jgi:hypothetical protein
MARLSPPLTCRAATAEVRTTVVDDVLMTGVTADVVGLTTAAGDDTAILLDLTNTEEDELT